LYVLETPLLPTKLWVPTSNLDKAPPTPLPNDVTYKVVPAAPFKSPLDICLVNLKGFGTSPKVAAS